MGIKIDRHTDLINWLCSTFDVRFSGYLAQVHKYDGYRPEPEIELEDGRPKTPDIVAVNYEKQIALVIDCKGGLDKQLMEKFHAEIDTRKIQEQIDDYSTISRNSLIKYFPRLILSEMDIIIATYPDLWDDLEKIRKDFDVKRRALWLFNDDEKRIYKIHGNHTDTSLNESLVQGVPLPSHYPSIINFSRHSDKNHIAGEGLTRLLLYALYYADFDFNIEKIDQILSGRLLGIQETSMPLLWQLNKEERYSRWRHMIGKAVENRWMREAHPGVYRFLNIHRREDLDDSITEPSVGTMVRRIRRICGLHG